MSTSGIKLRINCKIRINRVRINRTQPVMAHPYQRAIFVLREI